MTQRTIRSWLATFGALVIAVVIAAIPAGAHSGQQSYLYLSVSDLVITGRVELPLADVRAVFDIDIPDDASSDETLALIDPRLGDIQTYADEHLTISGADGTTLTVTFEGSRLLPVHEVDQDGNYLLLPFELSGFETPAPRRFEITFDPLFDEIDGRDALLLIENDLAGGVYGNENEFLLGFDNITRTRDVDLGPASAAKNFWTSVELGVDHIEHGADHIAFILALLLPSVLVFSTAWHPTDDFGSAVRRLLGVAAAFTIAHSSTFWLFGLGILPSPPGAPIEVLVAMSIVIAAVHSVRPLVPNEERWLAFGFGLFHGISFASSVDSLDASRSSELVSLLGRNIGIEIGQLIVLGGCLPAIYLFRRTRFHRRLVWSVAVLLSVIAIGWTIERAAGFDLGVDSVVNPLVSTPGVLAVLAVLTVGSYAVFKHEAAEGRLVPTIGEVEGPPAVRPQSAGVLR